MDIDLNDLRAHSTAELVKLAHQAGIEKATSLGPQDLVFELLCQRMPRGAQAPGSGVLEILPDGFGFLRTPRAAYLPGADDIYVSPSQIRRFHLRTGDYVAGRVRAPKESERYIALIKVEQVNGYDPELRDRPLLFDNLTARHPAQQLVLEHDPNEHTTRLLDLLAPIGLGQRVMVHADTDAGPLLLYRVLIEALHAKHPEIIPYLLLVHTRPEDASELADLPCEVVATTFDEPPSRHTQAAEIVNQRARRLAEAGRDVVVLVHSLTQLCRAYEELAGGTTRMGTSGLDASILSKPRRLLADARRLAEGGSLTVVATLSDRQPSRLDRAVAQAFEGTTSANIYLDSTLGQPGLLPGIDPHRSGSAIEHRIIPRERLTTLRALREGMAPESRQARRDLLEAMAACDSNDELLDKSS